MKRTNMLVIHLIMAGIFSTSRGQNISTHSDRATLFSQFTTTPIKIDGIAESAWDVAEPSGIAIAMTHDLSGPAEGCATHGSVRALWNGAQLYLLIDVTDSNVTAAGKKAQDKDGVEVYLDLWNDKFPKYEEDDGMIRINSQGELSGNGVYADRLDAWAVSSGSSQAGYTVELAIHIGGVPPKNGSTIGMDFGINDAVSPGDTCQYRIFWSDGNNRGLDDNTRWGNVILRGYDGKSPLAIDTYQLQTNIQKAESLARGIWVSETELDRSLSEARKAISIHSQQKIDAANRSLENAMRSLRRSGKYPDPFDLPEKDYLPDPFQFFDGKRVSSVADWSARRNEIKDLAQYYEYGIMPDPPEAVSASIDGNKVTISVADHGETASFNAMLTVPTAQQCGKDGPYPVIVSIDFWPKPPNKIYLDEGYAVLSVIYSSVASDNFDHTGAFYTLYPYDVTGGHDAGTLLAWAWGASRGVDALEYLKEKNPAFVEAFDLGKLVVTGFSRCGKAALFAGLMDERFGVVSPGASGCGGAAVYRYVSFGNTPHRTSDFGNKYPWGVSPGCEVLGDKIRHQGHNSNEMLPRFLNPGRMYKTKTNGYGERLPYDHHEIIAAIAPRAVLITTANDDYANNAEGDCIGLEGAKPVFAFLGVEQNLALNIRTSGEVNPWGWGGGHWQSDAQIQNLVDFANWIFYGKPLSEDLKSQFYSDPYHSTFDRYYGGLRTMMPWLESVPNLVGATE